MKICLAIPAPPPYGGITNWTRMLLGYMDRHAGSIQYSIINTSPKKRVTENRSLFERVFIGGFQMLKQNRELHRKLKTQSIDVLHMTSSGTLALIRDILFIRTAKKYRVSVVYHIRYGWIPELEGGNSLEWKLIRFVCKQADKVIAIDQGTYQTIQRQTGNCVYIPNPINLEELPISDEKEAEQRVIMFLGWVVPAKGVGELLEAWQSIPHNGWKICIVGPYKDSYLSELQSKYEMLDVIIKGEMKHADALEMLGKSAVFALPSYSEGFPNAVLEAMAMGRPVVATRVGAIPDMLSNGCGILIDPRNVEQLAVALQKVMQNREDRIQMGRLGRQRVETEYAMQVIFERYKSVWLDVRGQSQI